VGQVENKLQHATRAPEKCQRDLIGDIS